MKKFKNLTFTLRVLIGSIIMLHGLVRVFFVQEYIDFVVTHFISDINNKNLLIMGATFLPFLEFVSGAFVFFRVGIKKAVASAFCISFLMGFFILLGNLSYYRLLYHILIMLALVVIFIRYRNLCLNESVYNLSKSKIDSWS